MNLSETTPLLGNSMKPSPQSVLCYVEGRRAYFTTAPLDSQWGDDWNDAPYEYNAGTPYEEAGFTVTSVYFDGPYETPADKADGNSCYSVQSINQGAVAWLAPPSWFISRDKKVRPIPAGTTYQQFCAFMDAAGGTVYEPLK